MAAQFDGGAVRNADLVLLAVGVRPDTALAADAGLALGRGGAILVDDHMKTSAPDIYAVGDAVEVRQFVSQQPTLLPLAGPANKQGRIAAGEPEDFAKMMVSLRVGAAMERDELLKKLIAEEDKRKPLSDQKLCERMSAQGCALSRRTVAKYRDELHIPSTTGRKQYE